MIEDEILDRLNELCAILHRVSKEESTVAAAELAVEIADGVSTLATTWVAKAAKEQGKVH